MVPEVVDVAFVETLTDVPEVVLELYPLAFAIINGLLVNPAELKSIVIVPSGSAYAFSKD